ncbi:hypothetical protein ACJMK2_016147 [Sinanodonta woodiana]|uniref:F-box domain-containing protein n=1 Tax=Sinanodonta woodiana TaxID=1069815 RepID=A0ABD3USP8_SINWO
MAPNCPEEVDVFTVPHSRMKELVQKYLDMIISTNFSDVFHLTTLLKNLLNTFHEFKAHEQIENKYIMKKLKSKLKALSIQNTAVCNCHKDNKLTDILSLLEDGYQCTKKSDAERINYGIKLRKALEDFTQDFIPHMEEEEEVFQPLLMKYFTFEELRELKAQVLEQHFEKTEPSDTSPDSEKYVQDSLSTETKEEEKSDNPEKCLEIEELPDEVLLNIFSYLNPQDLCRSAQVCRNWNKLAFHGSFWKQIFPVQWSKGHWDYHLGDYVEEDDEENVMDFMMVKKLDEDADIDESEGIEEREEDSWACQVRHESQILTDMIKYLIPKVGSFIRTCSFAYSKGLSNGILYRLFSLCPNMEYLDLTQTRITDLAFKGLEQRKGGCKLHHLDLSGCLYITDRTLTRLAHSYGVTNHRSGHSEVSDSERQYDGKTPHHQPVVSDSETQYNSKTPHHQPVVSDSERQYDSKTPHHQPVVSDSERQYDGKTPHHQPVVELSEESGSEGHDKLEYLKMEKKQKHGGEIDSLDTMHPIAPEKEFLDNDDKALDLCVTSYEDRPLSAVTRSESWDKNAKQKEIDIENCVPNPGFVEKLPLNAKKEQDTHFHLDDRAAVPGKIVRKFSSDAGFHSSWTSLPAGESLGTARYIHFQGLPNSMVQNMKNLPSCDLMDSSTFRRYSDRKCYCDTERTTCCHTKPICDVLIRTNSEREPRTEYGSQTVPQRLDPGHPFDCLLEFLSLSGCFQITDEGLRSLLVSGRLPYLVHLDLSGCMKITGGGLDEFVSRCTRLNPERLFYCDNILDGPYPDIANGCQNLQCTSRVCCRSGE